VITGYSNPPIDETHNVTQLSIKLLNINGAKGIHPSINIITQDKMLIIVIYSLSVLNGLPPIPQLSYVPHAMCDEIAVIAPELIIIIVLFYFPQCKYNKKFPNNKIFENFFIIYFIISLIAFS
jgi:hypothetical protein